MDALKKTEKYQEAILDFLNRYAEEMYSDDPSGIETLVVADKENHHYLLLRVGWNDHRHIHYCPFHFDIKNDKVWVQINNTEEMVGDALIERGIPKSDIVLAFHPREMRQYTGFAET